MKNKLTKLQAKRLQGQVAHLMITNAHKAYMEGKIGPWELQEVIEKCGFKGWTGTSDGKLIVHGMEGACS